MYPEPIHNPVTKGNQRQIKTLKYSRIVILLYIIFPIIALLILFSTLLVHLNSLGIYIFAKIGKQKKINGVRLWPN